MSAAGADAAPEARGALRAVSSAAAAVARAAVLAVDIAGTANTDVANGGSVSDLGAVEFLIEAHDGAFLGVVGIASSSNAGVEALGRALGLDRASGGGRGGGGGGTVGVTGAASARVGVAVGCNGWVWLRDEKVGRHLGRFGWFWLWK
jgi:hypothetical protein